MRVQEDGPSDRVDAFLRAGSAAAGAAWGASLGLPPGLAEGAIAYVAGFISTPGQKRRDESIVNLAKALREIERRVGRLENVQDNDALLDVIFAAAPIAMRDASEAKRAALRNAIVNTALPGAPSDARVRAFMRLIDELDEIHARLLHFLADPHAFMQGQGLPVETAGHGYIVYESIGPMTERAFKGFGDREMLELAIDELLQRKLSTFNPSVECRPGHGVLTNLGREFLRFISDPPPAEGHHS